MLSRMCDLGYSNQNDFYMETGDCYTNLQTRIALIFALLIVSGFDIFVCLVKLFEFFYYSKKCKLRDELPNSVVKNNPININAEKESNHKKKTLLIIVMSLVHYGLVLIMC